MLHVLALEQQAVMHARREIGHELQGCFLRYFVDAGSENFFKIIFAHRSQTDQQTERVSGLMPNQKWERQELESVKLCKTRLIVILRNPSIKDLNT